jgi:aryl-alcohol dehydrogenase-like predicted oxidoreductase
MHYREFGRTGWHVSEIGFGAWAIGGDWGYVNESDGIDALETAIAQGVNIIDTADVYGDGRSEQIIAKVLKNHGEKIYVTTKAGRRLNPHTSAGYNRLNLTQFVERSLRNLDVETLDLVQLHCPPNEVYYTPEVFGILDDLVQAGKIQHYGVSVAKVEEGIKALEYPNIQSVQIIFNIFRQRPADIFFGLARQKKVAILARVPLASGLLTGKMTDRTTFPNDDHRNFNRHGESFDVGETFAGVDYATGLRTVELLRPLVPEGMSMTQFALRWILMFEAVTTTIPSSKNRTQAFENTNAAGFPLFGLVIMEKIRDIYVQNIQPQVHQRW